MTQTLMQTWHDPAFDHFNLNLTNIGEVVFYQKLTNQSNMIIFPQLVEASIKISATKTNRNKPYKINMDQALNIKIFKNPCQKLVLVLQNLYSSTHSMDNTWFKDRKQHCIGT